MKRAFYFIGLCFLLSIPSSAATFVVDNLLDVDPGTGYTVGDGTNSLRKCIRLANLTVPPDNISFNLPGPGPYVIPTATNLVITTPVVIDGYTQPTAAPGNLLVEIRGAGGITIFRLNAGSNGSTIRGLVINSSAGNNTAIYATASANHIFTGNYIGTNAAGTALGGTVAIQNGIDLDGATGCTIGGTSGAQTRNLISACSNIPIRIRNSSHGTTIQGNYIGTTVSGNTSLTNGNNGIDISSSSSQTIGGSLYTARNVICGSTIGLNVSTCATLTIKGNFIGLGADGVTSIANTSQGIRIQNTTSTIVIGGPLAAERNVISSNGNDGINMSGTLTGITIQNNYIGFDSTGLVAKGNSGDGIDMTNGNTVLIGGSSYNLRNVIGNNNGVGVKMTTSTVSTVVKGNFIGLAANGFTAAPNTSQGIQISSAVAVTIGGPLKQERNVIGSNGGDGINMSGTITGVTVQNNYIGFDSVGTTSRPNTGDGIDITGGSTILIGGSAYHLKNVIGNNTAIGIKLSTGTVTCMVKGNFIGLSSNGAAAGNNGHGMQILSAVAVTIGGPLKQERNVIGSNGNDGINMNGTITGLTVQNNYIGFDSTGTIARSNAGDGMDITGASTILIGGSAYNLRNVIGNNTQVGIRMSNSTVSTVIKANFIGLASNGAVAGNGNNGIQINTAVAVTIGGPAIAERNVIGSNNADGMNLNAITGVTIQNNYVGFDSTGVLARINTGDGIEVSGTSSTILIGGTAYNLRNLIGNNSQAGIRINNATVSTTIKGNIIGLALNNTTNAGNGANGMDIQNAVNVSIGGLTLPERNIVSCNTQRGISMNTCTPVLIQNNYVGLDSTGLVAKGNLQRGISVSVSSSLTIGGTSFNARNVVANNGQVGIAFDNSPNAVLKGNFIGLAKNGTTAMGNGNQGLLISNSNSTTVGGPTLAERNVISSNLQRGVEINNSNNVTFVNNYVGVDSTGSLMRGNLQVGVAFAACGSPVVGGTSVNLRNIISNNGYDGLRIDNSATPLVQGNYIGVDVTGLLDFGNGETGINIYNAGVATVGGSTYSARNISSGNGQDGIFLHDGCAGSIIKANFTGVGKDGTTIIGNGNSGIRVWGNATSNGIIIGGSSYAERNVTAANGATATSDSRDGIRLEGGAGGHLVKGNFCGTDSTGTLTTGYGNTWAGISINEVNAGVFGGTGANEGNVSGNNGHEGIWLRNATNNSVIGNFVGTDRSATVQMGNGEFGINVRFTSLNNTIGGSAAERNIVAYTKSDAVDSSGTGVFIGKDSKFNKITYNKIYCNNFLGITLQATANESIAAPSVTAADPNTVSGTGSIDGDIIHVYHTIVSGGACDCEGETFIGTAVVSGGTWSLLHGMGYAIPTAYDVTATETTAANSTSQFSVCNAALPVEFISFTVKKFSDRNIAIQWSTGWEENNSYFLVERKNAKGEFESIARVSGRGNAQGLSVYFSEDQNPLMGINYYRIRQVDVDGHSTTTAIRAIQVDGDGLQILLTTEGVGILSPLATTATLGIYSELGQELVQKQIQLNANTYYPVSIGLQNGIYLFYVSTLEKSVWKKVPIR